MVDKDGKFTYSQTLRVSFVRADEIKVYPTIISKGGIITINVGQNTNDKINYSIVDVTGKIVQTADISINNLATIKLKTDLPVGTYFLRILSDGDLLKHSTIIIQ